MNTSARVLKAITFAFTSMSLWDRRIAKMPQKVRCEIARELTSQAILFARAAVCARDEDHDSTPAQWRIGESSDVSRFLLERRAKRNPRG